MFYMPFWRTKEPTIAAIFRVILNPCPPKRRIWPHPLAMLAYRLEKLRHSCPIWSGKVRSSQKPMDFQGQFCISNTLQSAIFKNICSLEIFVIGHEYFGLFYKTLLVRFFSNSGFEVAQSSVFVSQCDGYLAKNIKNLIVARIHSMGFLSDFQTGFVFSKKIAG